MHRLLAVLGVLLALTPCLFADEASFSSPDTRGGVKRISVGGNLGANMNSREGWAFAFGVHGDYQIIDNLKVGIQFGMSHDFQELFALEPSAYVKWYLPFDLFMFKPFIQGDLGASVLIAEETFGRFLAGFSAGVRYNIGNIYIEPRAQFGYPYFFAFNAAVGYSF